MTPAEEWRDPEIQSLLADIKKSIDAYRFAGRKKISGARKQDQEKGECPLGEEQQDIPSAPPHTIGRLPAPDVLSVRSSA
jgi:hypothetical protein